MKKKESIKNKFTILIISLILALVIFALYFFDKSLNWNAFKIISCIIITPWVFCTIPALRYSFLLNIDKSLEEWIRMGYSFGISGICKPVLFAPYYCVRYYFNF